MIFALGALIASTVGVIGYSGRWHPSDARYPIQGIDVSSHQGQIGWKRLQSQGVDFVYIKATEGGDFVDRQFENNWNSAGQVGLKRGAYHFFTLCRSGADQAKNFIAQVPYDPSSLPPVVDLEFLGNCSTRPTISEVNKELSDYIGVAERHYGKRVYLYLTQEFDEKYEISKRHNRPLWLRSLIFEPRFGARPWTIWQVSNFRKIDGIVGRVDWNAMREIPASFSGGIQAEKTFPSGR